MSSNILLDCMNIKMTINNNKYFVPFICMLPMSAYAHGLSVQALATGALIYFLPFILGIIIAGKGGRLWFFILSVLFYAAVYIVVSLQNNVSNILFIMILPYFLLIFAYLKRKTVQSNKKFNMDSGADAPPPVN